MDYRRNMIVDSKYVNQVKDVIKKDILNKVKDVEKMEEWEKIFLSCLIFNKINTLLLNKEEITISVNSYLDKIFKTCYHEVLITREKFKLKMDMIMREINDKKYALTDFLIMQEEDIDYIATLKTRNDIEEIIGDSFFSTTLFKVNKNNIIVPRKVSNLKELFDNVIYPIILYYKRKFNITKTILIVEESITKTSKQQMQGKAVIFRLDGIPIADIIDDIVSRRIDINFGMMKRMGEKNLFITLPIVSNGKNIDNIYIENNNEEFDLVWNRI